MGKVLKNNVFVLSYFSAGFKTILFGGIIAGILDILGAITFYVFIRDSTTVE